MVDRVLTALFASDLDKLGEEIEARARHDLQNSTCSDTVGHEEFSLSGDQFEVFEVRSPLSRRQLTLLSSPLLYKDHFLRPLLEMASVNDLWTAPVVNAYHDLSPSSPSQSSGLILTLFQLSAAPLSSSPPPTHSFTPLIGPSVVTILPDIPLALHATSVSSISTPIMFPSLSVEGEEKAVVIAPTHVRLPVPLHCSYPPHCPQIQNTFWILVSPWSLLTLLPLPALSSPPTPVPIVHTRLLEGFLASLQRFALFLPLSVPNFDPHDVGMVSELLSPKAPSQHDAGGLSPVPPPSQHTNARPSRARRLSGS